MPSSNSSPTDEAIDEARRVLEAGGVIGLPTETVYGLGADATSSSAVRKIFTIKGRPADHPLIVHVADIAAARALSRSWPSTAEVLAASFWPGPLTIIVERGPQVLDVVTGGRDTVAIRIPRHAMALRLLQQFGRPVAAPSANRFGRVSPTTADHVRADLGPEVDLVLDGGPCEVGLESTIVDCTRGVPVLLRPGAITRDDIERACGTRPLSMQELTADTPRASGTLLAHYAPSAKVRLPDTPRASGTLLAHYAPSAKVRLMDAKQLQSALDVLGADARHIAVYHRSPLRSDSRHLRLQPMPGAPLAAARELFGLLRDFDDWGAKLIWIETPPDSADWEGVSDRLQRAAAAG